MNNAVLKNLGFLALPITTIAWTAQLPIRVDESHAKDYWLMAKSTGTVTPLVPGDMRRSGSSGCVTVGYTIDADGKVKDAEVLRSYITKKDGDEMRAHFEKAVVANTSEHRYAPAASNNQRLPISTFVTIVVSAGMGLPRKNQLDEISSHCKTDVFTAMPSDSTQTMRKQ